MFVDLSVIDLLLHGVVRDKPVDVTDLGLAVAVHAANSLKKNKQEKKKRNSDSFSINDASPILGKDAAHLEVRNAN